MTVAVRIALVVVAVVVAAWFGLAWSQDHQTQRATALVAGGNRLTPSQVRKARSALDSAGALNPDRAVAVLRGELAIDQGQYRSAIRTLRGVTTSEPLNLTAWAELGIAAAKAGDRATLVVAGRHIAVLIPRVK